MVILLILFTRLSAHASLDFFDLTYMYNLEHFQVRVLDPGAFGAQDTIRTVSKELRLNTLQSVRIILDESEVSHIPLEVYEEHSDPVSSDWAERNWEAFLFDFDDNYLVAKDGLDMLLDCYDARVMSPNKKCNGSF